MFKTYNWYKSVLIVSSIVLAGLLAACSTSPAIKGNVGLLQTPAPQILENTPDQSIQTLPEGQTPFVEAPTTSNSDTSEVQGAQAEGTPDAPMSQNAQASNENNGTHTDIAMSLVFDISGSMDDPSALTGTTKLDSAKRQSTDFVSSIRCQGSDGFSTKIGVASFATDGWEDCPLSTDANEINSSINNLSAWGRTNMYAGLSIGIDQLSGESGEKLLVFLSDGLNNEGYGEDEIRNLAHSAAEKDIKIYTIGFGLSSDLDEALLRDIAEITNGAYSHEDSSNITAAAVGLFATMMDARLQAEGEILISGTGSVAQGATVEAGEFNVPQNGVVKAYLYWPGSVLDLFLTDPDGVEVDQSYAGYSIDTSTIPTTVTIDNAKAGTWRMAVHGREVSMVQEPFYAAASLVALATPTQAAAGGTSNSGSGLMLIFGIVVIASIVGVYAFSRRAQEEAHTRELYG